VLCCAVLCRAVLWCAVLCCAVLCYALCSLLRRASGLNDNGKGRLFVRYCLNEKSLSDCLTALFHNRKLVLYVHDPCSVADRCAGSTTTTTRYSTTKSS
jgi:hypothetical protein